MTGVEIIRMRLLQIQAYTDLVGSRIYALVLAQDAVLPATRLQQIDVDEPMHLRGSTGLVRARVQVDHYAHADDGIDAYAVASQVHDAAHGRFDNGLATGLLGWQGSLGSPAIKVTSILPAAFGRREDFDPEEKQDVRVSRDYFVTWRQ